MGDVHIPDVVTTQPIPHERVLDGAAENLDPESPMEVLQPAAQAPWGETPDSDLPAMGRAMGRAKAAWSLIRRKLKESVRAYAVQVPRQTAHNREGKSRE